ncbi:hypothetical protein INT47_008114 [Mucor saturninus]|uniref:Ubiquitin carboxyl-terminal hydrolase n=1 Tax=Mucor saturninus TaxID=64648 RepID=A0A8H7R0E1_9FUNG|nr:hypothetical protein INT47_008114 [Mucor saturninus]
MTKENTLLNEDIQPSQQLKESKPIWIPIESNPDVLNKIIHENGVDPTWSFIDILGFDEESIAELPNQVAAIIFLFADTENYLQFRDREDAHLKIHEQSISPNLMYFKQTITHACGMMALLHSLANNAHLVGPGLFSKIIEDTSNMSPEERGEYLETCQELAKIHDSAARQGQSKIPSQDSIIHHFVCFVNVDDHLYELDGSRVFPINHGKSTNFVKDAVTIMTQAVGRDPDEIEYSAIAFTKTA